MLFAWVAAVLVPFTTLELAVNAAVEHAKLRAAQEVQVVMAEEVTWSDGSMDCPRPGMAYGQALVPGYRIRLQAGERTFDYHASVRGALVLCPPERIKKIPAPRDSR